MNRSIALQSYRPTDFPPETPVSVGNVRRRWHLTAVNEFIWRNQQFSVSAFVMSLRMCSWMLINWNVLELTANSGEEDSARATTMPMPLPFWSPHRPLRGPYWQSRSPGDKQIAGAAVQRKTTIMRRTQVSFFVHVWVLVNFWGLVSRIETKALNWGSGCKKMAISLGAGKSVQG